MKLNPKEAAFLRAMIRRWVAEGRLTEEQGRRLEESFHVTMFDWRNIAQLAFITAISCGVISFVIVLRQDLLVQWLYRLINAPYPVLCGLFAALAAAAYGWAWRRKQHYPARVFTNETLVLVGGVFTGASLAFLGQTIAPGLENYAPFVLVAAAVYLILGKALPSLPLWLTGLAALGWWFGMASTRNWGGPDYWLGMNYPLRFIVFGALLSGVAIAARRFRQKTALTELTYFSGLLYLFVAAWLFSIVGNYADWESWRAAAWPEFAAYSLLLTLGSGIAVWWGARSHDSLLRGFGIIFFLLNLYTKFFEHGWDNLHRALFFGILALSFWLIGRRAERIWYFDPTEMHLLSYDREEE